MNREWNVVILLFVPYIYIPCTQTYMHTYIYTYPISNTKTNTNPIFKHYIYIVLDGNIYSYRFYRLDISL